MLSTLQRSYLRLMKYPSREMLISLGRWASRQGGLTQKEMGNRIRELGMVSLYFQESCKA